MYEDLVVFGALDFAIEAQKLVQGDMHGKKRKYTDGYMMVATSLRAVLGRSSFEKLARSGMWALPVEATLKRYVPARKIDPHFKEISKETEKALLDVMFLFFFFLQSCYFDIASEC